MPTAPKPVPRSTRWILVLATTTALLALLAAAIVFDEQAEAGDAASSGFALLIGLIMGPGVLGAGAAALALSGRPHRRQLLPLALAAIGYGVFATWLFFMETAELPRLTPW